jgi:hypothetical protein
MAESLNDAWDEFVRKNEEFYIDQENSEPFELTTKITIRLPDGNEATATLCICFFDNTKERYGTDEGGHIGIQFDMETLYDEDHEPIYNTALVDVLSNWGTPWTRQQIEHAFHVNPDSPIWERENVS